MYSFAMVGIQEAAALQAEQIQKQGRLLAVCDTDEEKASALAAACQAQVYTSLDHLLKAEPEVQVIWVGSPVGLHAEHTIKSLQAGRHVLCQSPLCITSVAGVQMVDTAHFFRRRLIAWNPWDFSPSHLSIRDRVKEHTGTWQSFQLKGYPSATRREPLSFDQESPLTGSVFHQDFFPYLDLLSYLLEGFTIEKFMTYEAGESAEQPAARALRVHTQEGLSGTMHFHGFPSTTNNGSSITVSGTKGSVRISGSKPQQLEWIHPNEPEPSRIENVEEGAPLIHEELDRMIQGNDPRVRPANLRALQTLRIVEKIHSALLQTQPA